MSWLEIFLATLNNLSVGAGFIFFLSAIGVAACFFANVDQDFESVILKRATIFWCRAFVVSSLILILPTPSDVLKVRISLIKLQLASPENVQSSVETIERIGQKLECKYLGCAIDRNSKKTRNE